MKEDDSAEQDDTQRVDVADVADEAEDVLGETKIVKNRIVRGLLIVMGTFSLGLGIIGIVLPVLPTTPLLLLAAACYARSSEKFHNWLLNHRWFGDYIRNYQEGKGIPARVKVLAISFLWITILFSTIFIITFLLVRVILIVIATIVTIHILSLKTLKKEEE